MSATEPTVTDIKDHGMWRGKHTWSIRMQVPGRGPVLVEATGDTEAEALDDARATIAAARVVTPEQREQLQAANMAMSKVLGL